MGPKEDEISSKTVLIIVVSALLGTGGSGIAYKLTEPTHVTQNRKLIESVERLSGLVQAIATQPTARPDAYTGKDGQRDRDESKERDQLLQRQVDALTDKLDQHLIRGEAGFQRIEELERKIGN